MESLARPRSYRIALNNDEELETGAVKIIDPSDPSAKASENDPVFGAQSTAVRCMTCFQGIDRCPGHLGGIRVYPIPAPVAYSRLVQWLSIICSECGRIGLTDVDKSNLVARRGVDFKGIRNMLQSKGVDYICPYCAKPFRTFKPVGYPTQTGFDYANSPLFYVDSPHSQRLNGPFHSLPIADNRRIINLLRNATRQDVIMVGFDPISYRPHYMIKDIVPISPPAARPISSASIRQGSSRMHKLYGFIVKCQTKIFSMMGKSSIEQLRKDMPANTFDDLITWIFYLYHILEVIQTKLPENLLSIISKQFKLGAQQDGVSFTGMLRHKVGVLRKLLSSSRHDVNIRTPLAANAYGAIGTATCPINMAMKICVERLVTVSNIELMRSFVRNGPEIYPGANSYRKGDTTYKISIGEREEIAQSLVPGDTVLRHIVTGDIAFHQRYPSLREESINAVMLIVDDGKLVRIPLAGCARMMADFDGDDTELFFPSSYSIAAESFYLMSSITQLIAPFDGKPCIGIGAGGDAGTDVIFGLNILRKIGVFTQQQVYALFNELFTSIPAPVGKESYTYTDIVNTILPRELFYDGAANGDNPSLLIEGGEVMKGLITHKGFEIFGSNDAHITRAIARNIDPYTAIKVLEDITRIGYRATTMLGWTVTDCFHIREPFKSQMAKLIRERVEEIDKFCNRFHYGELSVPIGKDPLEYFEQIIIYKLVSKHSLELFETAVRMFKGTSFEYFNYVNEYKARIITTCISRGQVTIDEKRPRPMLDHGTRFTVWFPKSADTAKSGGYIAVPYIAGMSPSEFFYEMGKGRRDVHQKGGDLSVQGYMSRKTASSVGIIHTDYFGFTRGHGDTIVDFYYGVLGTDPRCVVNVSMNAHIISDAEFKTLYGPVKEEYEVLKSIRDEFREAIDHYSKITSFQTYKPDNTQFTVSIDINAIISTCTPEIGAVWKSIHPDGDKKGDKKLTREEIWAMLRDIPFEKAHFGENAGEFTKMVGRCRVKAFLRIFRFICSTDRLMRDRHGDPLRKESRWSREDLQLLINALTTEYALSLVPPGDLVGMRATLNVSAPQVQLVLHSIRGGGEVKGSVSLLNRTHGTKLFLEKFEGSTPKAPVTEFSLIEPMCYNFQECLDFMKSVSSVKLIDVMYNAWLVSISPEELATTTDCGMSILREYINSLPPSVKKTYEQTRRSWFYAVVHIDSLRLLINHVDISTIGVRLQEQFPEAIELAASVYDNRNGLYLFLSIAADSIDLLRLRFETIIDDGIVHGHHSFSNGTVVEYSGTPSYATDGSMKIRKKYRIVANGNDFEYLFSNRLIDHSTIFSSNILDSHRFFGTEEARFRAYEDLHYESSQSGELQGLLRRHLKVIVDYIAHHGSLTFVLRSSLGSNPNVDVLDKMTFEIADTFLMNSLVEGKWNQIRGITPCSLFGVPPPFGSTLSSVQVRSSDLEPPPVDEILDAMMDGVETKKKKGKKPIADRVVGTPIDEAVDG